MRLLLVWMAPGALLLAGGVAEHPAWLALGIGLAAGLSLAGSV